MRNIKRIISFLFVMVLTLAMTATVFADTFTISVSDSEDNHTYEVYQIFTGDFSDGTLSNIKWGQNGKGTEGEAVDKEVLDELAAVTSSTSDSVKLDTITKYAVLSNSIGTVTSTKELEVVPGYYLLKDVDGSLDGVDDAYTTYIVQVADNVDIVRKAEKPSVDKEVQDEREDAEDGADEEGYGKTADHAINESFNFRLTATIPDDPAMDAYETYYLEFSDTMSDGVTFEGIVSVTITTKNGEEKSLDTDKYSCDAQEGKEGGSWSLTIEDVKNIIDDIKGATVEVIYSAHLNEKAYVNQADGITTNRNDVELIYSNNPNAEGRGKTEPTSVFVFTYKVDNTKYSESIDEANVLSNAGFRLYDATGADEIGLIYDTDLAAYRPIKSGETGEEMKSAADGKFNIVGLDAGTYTLRETTTPAGYNTCADITIVISATHELEGDNAPNVSLESDTTGMVNDIINDKGTVLPSTGGIGTTIFYVVGGILVVAAGVLLVARRHVQK